MASRLNTKGIARLLSQLTAECLFWAFTPIAALLLFGSLSGCATRDYVPEQYGKVLRSSNREAKRTVVFILVDGLSEQTLHSALADMPNLRAHFRTSEGVFRAHTGFPSLTFPGVSSLLKEKPVSQTGFIGNTFYQNGYHINFEKPLQRKIFSRLMRGDSIFSRLNASGRLSVSLDYGLGKEATVSSPIEDFTTVVELSEANYLYADSKKLDSLRILLSENRPEQWPDFVFLHLVGVDFLTHDYGVQSQKPADYFKSLDSKLGDVFALLQAAENRREVVSLMSADHGFAPQAKYFLPIEKLVSKVANKFRLINESRMAAIYLDSARETANIGATLLGNSGIEAVAEKIDSGFIVRSRSEIVRVEFRKTDICPGETLAASVNGGRLTCFSLLNSQEKPFLYPFFLSNLAHYFAVESSPDLVVIPDSQTIFTENYLGNHGGPTMEEALVPLLLRNSRLSTGEIPPIWRLLEFVSKDLH